MHRTRSLLLAATVATAAVTLTACDDHGGKAAAASEAAAAPSEPAATPTDSNVISAIDTAGPSAAPTSASPTPTPSAARPTTAKPSAKASSPGSGTSGSGGSSSDGNVGYGYNPNADSAAAIAAAMGKAKADGRNVLLDFGATWCGNCKAIEKFFSNSTVQGTLNSSYHVVQIDIGDHVQANMKLLQGYDSSGSYTMPVLIVVTPDGTIRTDTNKTGLPKLTADGFTDFLKKWAP